MSVNDSTSKSWHGLDAHVLAMLLQRSWSVLAGGITVLLLPLCLDSTRQGYYFTFASILALQVFFELGMSQVVVQFVAHEAAHLRQGIDGRYEGEAESLGRLKVLTTQLRGWYIAASFLFVIIVSGIGWALFRDGGLGWLQWAPAWLVLVIATGINLNFSWKTAMVEGFAKVRDIARLRLQQSIVGFVLMWVGLVGGAGLWVVVVVPLVAAVTTAIWLRSGAVAPIFQIQLTSPPKKTISWRHDILPFQWRIAVSWISGYFIFQLFTPLMFRHAGAEEAGRIGLAITVFSTISVLGMSWVNAKAPYLAMLIARRESKVLLQQFKFVALRSIVATGMLCGLFMLVVWCGIQFDIPLVNRISSLPVIWCLALVTVANCAIFSAAIFMRAHREEPMLAQSVVCGLLIAIGSWYFSKNGPFQMMLSYVMIVVIVGLPWTLWILKDYLARHQELATG